MSSGLQESEEGQGSTGVLQVGGSGDIEKKSQGVFQKGGSLGRVLRKGKSTCANKEFIGSYYKERQGGADVRDDRARLKDP